MAVTIKLCACGCPHKLTTSRYDRLARDDHQKAREGCRCDQFVKPEKLEKYRAARAKLDARLSTPEEQERLAAEVDRLAEAAAKLEPLDAVLTRLTGRSHPIRRKE